jgi:hypothetical protein
MLIALIAVLFISSSTHPSVLIANIKQTEILIKENVHDEARREEALKIMDLAAKDAKVSQEEQQRLLEPLKKVLDRRGSTSSEIEAVVRPLAKVAVGVDQRQLDWRFQLKTLLTEGEWSKVFPPPAGVRE